MKTYCTKTWLMSEESGSTTTSSVCCYDGYKFFGDKNKKHRVTDITINDCRRSVQLHTGNFETTTDDFISRLKVLEREIHNFIEHLESAPKEVIYGDE